MTAVLNTDPKAHVISNDQEAIAPLFHKSGVDITNRWTARLPVSLKQH